MTPAWEVTGSRSLPGWKEIIKRIALLRIGIVLLPSLLPVALLADAPAKAKAIAISEVKEFPPPVSGGKVVVNGRYARSYDATGKLIAISFEPSGQAQAMAAASTPALTDIAAIPNPDRTSVGSDAKSLTGQMQKCLEDTPDQNI